MIRRIWSQENKYRAGEVPPEAAPLLRQHADVVAEFIRALMLGHLSENNNHPELARQALDGRGLSLVGQALPPVRYLA